MNKSSKGEQPATNEWKAATFGEFLSDGTSIEIIRPDACQNALSLLVWTEGVLTETRCAQRDGVGYVPVEPDTSILRAMYIPSGVSEYGTTSSLFAEIMDVFTSRLYLLDTSATLLTDFSLCTWFADSFSKAPQMLIFGPPEESAILVQLLTAICRRALVLSDVNIGAWSSPPAALSPTLIINTRRLRTPLRDFLEASNTRHQYVVHKGQLLDPFGAKVIYEQTPSRDQSLLESAVCVAASRR